MKKIIIAIDGYSACGKSTTAKLVAKALNYKYIDTGAMYRCVTLYFNENNIRFDDPDFVSEALKQIQINFRYNPATDLNETYLNGRSVEDSIRAMDVSKRVSEVSALKVVREEMVKQQRQMGEQKGVVMDGRDIGTVVFPKAELKVFMTAEFNTRAERRLAELHQKGHQANFNEVKENLKRRDLIDTQRKEGPLRKHDQAMIVDTSNITIIEQVRQILEKTKAIIGDL